MFDILALIPGKKRHTNSGWTSFNALCCDKRGHKPDRRNRGGIKKDGVNWTYHCFNCGYSCRFELGKTLNGKVRSLLKWCGVDDTQIQRYSLESLQQKDILSTLLQNKKSENIKFKTFKIPEGESLKENDSKHKIYVDYLKRRKIDLQQYQFYVNPEGKQRDKYGIIIPYTYHGKVVGNTTRFIDGRIPKFINNQQTGYVFNVDKQRYDWQVAIVTEGIFDAMCIDGLALMHDDISNEQAIILATLNRKIIVVPDRDEAGLKITDRALDLGYSVSLPNWHNNVKDVNDAVVKYGKLPTLLSILESATTSKIKVEMRKKQIGRV